MTKILALDTSTDACSVALWLDGEVLESFEVSPRSHTQRLLPMVDALLKQGQIAGGELDALAFGAGPGSFTGLRICLGVVQGLAFGWQKPVVPVSTLRAMALGAKQQLQLETDQQLIVALDARMNEVYAGAYRCTQEGVCALAEDAVLAPSSVLPHFSMVDRAKLNAVGPGWHYPELAQNSIEITLECYPKACDIVRLAAVDFEAYGGVAADKAEPIYLRNTISWQKREKKRSV